MDKLISISEEIRKELDDLPLFQEYLVLKKEIDNNDELKELKKEILIAKKENRINDHHKLLEQYNNHPLMVNYVATQNEVRDYLKEISDILNEK